MSQHFKFIEIGSCHFDTLIHEYGLNVRGLLVEPIAESFNLIPTSDTIVKENCAITNHNGTIDMYIHFNRKMSRKWKFSSRKELNDFHKETGNWIYSSGSDMNSINENKFLPTKSKRKVRCMTFYSLIEKYQINEVDVLKIDTEGHDHIILKQVYECIKSNQLKINDLIRYEKNKLSSHEELKKISDLLKDICNFKNEEYKEKQMEVFLTK